jgi:hypothetical protein
MEANAIIIEGCVLTAEIGTVAVKAGAVATVKNQQPVTEADGDSVGRAPDDDDNVTDHTV